MSPFQVADLKSLAAFQSLVSNRFAVVTASLRSVAVPQLSDALLLLGFAGVATAITRVPSLSTSLIAHCYGLQLNLS